MKEMNWYCKTHPYDKLGGPQEIVSQKKLSPHVNLQCIQSFLSKFEVKRSLHAVLLTYQFSPLTPHVL